MPNWCTNDVTITSDNNEEFQAFLVKAGLDTEEKRAHAQTYGSNHNLFNRLVPMPENLRGTTRDGSSPEAEFINAMAGNKDYDYTNWYDWSLANWGTKWDVDPTYVDLTDNKLSLSYDTAWSPANAVWEAVTVEFPSLLIQVNYLEEGIGFIGKTWYQGGEEILDEGYESIPEEMYVSAGAILDKDGKIDWDEDQTYNLFDVFDDEKFFTVSK